MMADQHLPSARSLLANALNIPDNMIGDDATIDGLESWDSLGHLRLVFAIEQHLRRELSPIEIVGIASLTDIERLLAPAAAV